MGRRPKFFLLLGLARHRLHRAADALCTPHGVTSVQAGALFVACKQPGLRQKDLGAVLGLKGPAVTGLVGRLEAAGLLRRAPSEDDRRAMCVFPTARGEALVDEARPILAGLNDRLMDGFSDEELAVVERFLSSTIERFDGPSGGGRT